MPPRNTLFRLPALALGLVVLLVAGVVYFTAFRDADDAGDGGPPAPKPKGGGGDRIFETNDVLKRACALPKEILARTWRGYYPGRTFELILVPQFPNYPGSFGYTGHSGPWDYLQRVPLILAGSGIASAGTVKRDTSLTDVYPTMNELLDAGFAPREGELLEEAVAGSDDVPRLIVTVVWDGVGRNVLERWPDAWPNLKRLEEEGTSYYNAYLGSSPSITPATHSTLGTGVFPREHGIPTIQMGAGDGSIKSAFIDRDPEDLEATTFGDEYDVALDNEPKVGMLAWKSWHLGMLSHGTQIEGADADQLGIFGGKDGDITGNDVFYSTPDYLNGFLGLEEAALELDRADGEVDGKWLGHEVPGKHANPAWVSWQTDAVLEFLEQEEYGQDEVPDLFYTNYKIADIVGHEYSMESPEMEALVKAEDEALGQLLDYLDSEVQDYAIVLTADHGHTPPSSVSGGWPVNVEELNRDMLEHFGVSEEETFVQKVTSAGFYLDQDKMKSLGITGDEIAEFVNGYTIREDWGEDTLPEGFEDRGDEHVFSAAFLQRHMPEIMRCKFGQVQLPDDAPL